MIRRKERGSLTVEAAVFLVIFIMAFCTVLNFARLVRAEVIVQHAINGTTMQISQYGYLLTKTGIAGQMMKTAESSKKTKENIDDVKTAVMNLSEAIGGVSSHENPAEAVDAIVDAATGEQAEKAEGIIKNYYQNPKELITEMTALGKNYAEETIATGIVSKLAKKQVEAYVYLKGIGIIGGLEGLDFKDSKCIAGGTKDIYITVKFRVKNQMFPGIDFGEKKMCLNAATRIW